MNADDKPRTNSQSHVFSLLSVLIMSSASPNANVRYLRTTDYQNLIGDRYPDTIRNGVQATVSVSKPAGKEMLAMYPKLSCTFTHIKGYTSLTNVWEILNYVCLDY